MIKNAIVEIGIAVCVTSIIVSLFMAAIYTDRKNQENMFKQEISKCKKVKK